MVCCTLDFAAGGCPYVPPHVAYAMYFILVLVHFQCCCVGVRITFLYRDILCEEVVFCVFSRKKNDYLGVVSIQRRGDSVCLAPPVKERNVIFPGADQTHQFNTAVLCSSDVTQLIQCCYIMWRTVQPHMVVLMIEQRKCNGWKEQQSSQREAREAR